MNSLLKATDSLARYDQMLKNIHNSKILYTPLRNQEVVFQRLQLQGLQEHFWKKGLIRTIEESSGRRPALYAFEPLLKLVRV